MDTLSIRPQSVDINIGVNSSTPNSSVNDREGRDKRINATSPESRDNRTQQKDGNPRQGRDDTRLKNVVSTSKDGDTVQVDPRTGRLAQRANEGTVRTRESRVASDNNAPKTGTDVIAEQIKANEEKKAELIKAQVEAEQKAKLEERQQAREDRNNEQITSFQGYTNSRLEQLYLQGRIAKSDYDREIAARNELATKQQSGSSQTAKIQAKLNGTLVRSQMNAGAIDTAFSNRANNNSPASASMRIDAMQRIQDNRQRQDNISTSEGQRTWAFQLQA